MTFNLRCGHANDGPNNWPHRRDLLTDVIRDADPDVLAVQECIPDQADWLREKLPALDFHGTQRGGTHAGNEMCALLWKRDRLTATGTGTSWLSQTPDVPGSLGWDAAFPRIVTWASFHDTQTHHPPHHFTVANVHLDHQGAQAREQSAIWLRDWLPENSAVVLGDFNAVPGDPAYQQLTAPRPDGSRLVDAHRAAGLDETNAGTFHEFTGNQDSPRIDWIMLSPDARLQSLTTDQSHHDGRYPSDHFPVIADLNWHTTPT